MLKEATFGGLLRESALLGYSSSRAAAELASLKQSSPKTPALIVLLGMAAGDWYGAVQFSYCLQVPFAYLLLVWKDSLSCFL